MALTTKWCGNFTTTYNDHVAGTVAMPEQIRSTGTFDVAPVEVSEDFGEGDGCNSNGGYITTLVQTFDNIVEADLTTLRGYEGDVEVLFTKSGKTITFPGTAEIPNHQSVKVANGKVEVTTIARWPIDTPFETMFQTSV